MRERERERARERVSERESDREKRERERSVSPDVALKLFVPYTSPMMNLGGSEISDVACGL